jgi:hypothetical protein
MKHNGTLAVIGLNTKKYTRTTTYIGFLGYVYGA